MGYSYTINYYNLYNEHCVKAKTMMVQIRRVYETLNELIQLRHVWPPGVSNHGMCDIEYGLYWLGVSYYKQNKHSTDIQHNSFHGDAMMPLIQGIAAIRDLSIAKKCEYYDSVPYGEFVKGTLCHNRIQDILYTLYGIWKTAVDAENRFIEQFDGFGSTEYATNNGGKLSYEHLDKQHDSLPGSIRDEWTEYLAEQAAQTATDAAEGDYGLDELKEDHPEMGSLIDSMVGGAGAGSLIGSGSSWKGSGSSWKGSGSGGSVVDLGSDWDGSGSDWGSGWDDEWTSDLVDGTIDTKELGDATNAVKEASRVASDAMLAVGEAALHGLTDSLDTEACGILDQYGPQLAEMAQRYGLQAGLALGGAAALYATREQTTEAVAHVAEFFSTKCGPAVGDVMEQVSGVAQQTRVNLSNATSNMVRSVRGEKVGDLVG